MPELERESTRVIRINRREEILELGNDELPIFLQYGWPAVESGREIKELQRRVVTRLRRIVAALV